MRKLPQLRQILLAIAFYAAVAMQDAKAEKFNFEHEHVLGTSLELVVECPDQDAAGRAEAIALDEIDRLDRVLSGYRNDSEFSRWMRSEPLGALSRDLRTVLLRAEHWRVETSGAFDVRAEAVKQLYDCKTSVTAAARHALLEQLSPAPLPLSKAESLVCSDDLPLSLNALAKGYVLDNVCEVVLRELPQVTGCLINIGGDMRVAGIFECTAHITNPFDDSENSTAIARVRLHSNQALATSGTYRRFVGSGSSKVSHIFDPRTALPVDQMVSVSVVANSGIDADALATAMSVLTAAESLKLADQNGAACLLIDRSGARHRSNNWPGDTESSMIKFVKTAEESNETKGGLKVDFTLTANKQGGRYRRPYVAVWLEDSDGFPIKTAVLWLQTTEPGPRWHRDLTRWYRNDRVRKLAEEVDLIATISGATRGPGEYSARFDGTDNAGKPLSAGEYQLCIEVAREHGTYQIIRQKLAWGDKPISKTELKANEEISQASYSFEPVATIQ